MGAANAGGSKLLAQVADLSTVASGCILGVVAFVYDSLFTYYLYVAATHVVQMPCGFRHPVRDDALVAELAEHDGPGGRRGREHLLSGR